MPLEPTFGQGASAATESPAPPGFGIGQAPRAVTVVDDEPLAQDVLVRAARSWGFQCQAATTAEQALQVLEHNLTPVVITDLRMPGLGGLWLVREVRRRWPQVGVIVLTAGHDPESAAECLQAGAHHYFFKPIKLDELHHVLETTLRTCRLDAENHQRRRELEQAVKRQTRKVRRTFLSAITSLVLTMEERDPYTAGHSHRVQCFTLELARALGLDRRQRRLLGLAAQLHDIGKVAVPDTILRKPGRLTNEEMDIVREHPVAGERILAPIVRNRHVLAGIRGHHERIDGRGYPDGLSGDRIPLFARLIAIPDCFDALTTSRAYRAAIPVEKALEILRADAGTHFQPEFVEAFIRIAPRLSLQIPRPESGFLGSDEKTPADPSSFEERPAGASRESRSISGSASSWGSSTPSPAPASRH